MSSEYSLHYRTLEKILDGTVELWHIDDLETIIPPNAKRTRAFADFVVQENKKGLAPSVYDITYGIEIPRGSFWVPSRFLVRKEVAVAPSYMEYVALSGEWKRGVGMYLKPGPKNIDEYLRMNVDAQGSSLSWNKKLRPERLRSRSYKRFYLALLYDEKGPVYQNCFPGLDLEFKPRKLA